MGRLCRLRTDFGGCLFKDSRLVTLLGVQPPSPPLAHESNPLSWGGASPPFPPTTRRVPAPLSICSTCLNCSAPEFRCARFASVRSRGRCTLLARLRSTGARCTPVARRAPLARSACCSPLARSAPLALFARFAPLAGSTRSARLLHAFYSLAALHSLALLRSLSSCSLAGLYSAPLAHSSPIARYAPLARYALLTRYTPIARFAPLSRGGPLSLRSAL